MRSIVISITGASAILICEWSIHFFLEKNYKIDFIESCPDLNLKDDWALIISPTESQLKFIQKVKSMLLAVAGTLILPPILSSHTKTQTIEDIICLILDRLFKSDCEDFNYINRLRGPDK